MSRKPKGPRPTPGQINLGGKVLPDEPVNRMLVAHGFKAWRDQGSCLYTDPFRPGIHLTATQAKRLLHERMEVVSFGGYRCRYPRSAHSEARVSHRRATQHGAWHEMRSHTGEGQAPPGFWIIDGATNQRVWPPAEDNPPGVEGEPA